MKCALTIAGSDSSGGAGIQADIKTMLANGVYAMSAICALTAQNTMGVKSVFDVTPDFLGEQLDAVFEDIFPDAVKIGMISQSDNARVIAEKLLHYKAKNIVIDPVMVATSGSSLTSGDAFDVITAKLFPIATIITPNIPEAQVLASENIRDKNDMERVGKKLSKEYGCAVLIKGGHSINDADDVLVQGDKVTWFNGIRVDNKNTHGTGCTLSSAIASNLALGISLCDSIYLAKKYIEGALGAGLDLGHGAGPLDHGWRLEK